MLRKRCGVGPRLQGKRADERVRRIAVPIGARVVHRLREVAIEGLPDYTGQRLATPSCERHSGTMLTGGEVNLRPLLRGTHDVTS